MIVSLDFSRICLCECDLRYVENKIVVIKGIVRIAPSNKFFVNAVDITKKEWECITVYIYLRNVCLYFLTILKPVKRSIGLLIFNIDWQLETATKLKYGTLQGHSIYSP